MLLCPFKFTVVYQADQSGQAAKFHIRLPGPAVTEADGEPKVKAPLTPAAAAYCGSAACFFAAANVGMAAPISNARITGVVAGMVAKGLSRFTCIAY